jgi:hypothetical protein
MNAPGTRECRCGDPITPCYAEITWGHRHATGCRGWMHDGGGHACADGTVALPASAVGNQAAIAAQARQAITREDT